MDISTWVLEVALLERVRRRLNFLFVISSLLIYDYTRLVLHTLWSLIGLFYQIIWFNNLYLI